MFILNTTIGLQRETVVTNKPTFTTPAPSSAEAFAVRTIVRRALVSSAQAALIAELLGISLEVCDEQS